MENPLERDDNFIIADNKGFRTGNVHSEIDRELEEILKKQAARIKVVGVCGGGGNTISRMREIGIKGGEIIAINTDAQDLLYANADIKILIGRELSKGLGAGSNPRIGAEAAKEQSQEIKKRLENSDLVFITCGLGGGTGTGAAPIVAEIAKKHGALVIGVVTLPFTVEGAKRIENAMEGLERLEGIVDTLIVIPNDKLLELAPDLPLPTAFKVADEILTNAVKGINNPLLDVDIVNAKGALVNVIGGTDLALEEYKQKVQKIGEQLSPDAKLISGAQISKDLEKSIKVMVIITGVKSPQISGDKISYEEIKRQSMEGEIGIEFFEE